MIKKDRDSLGSRMKFYESFETERRLMPLVPAYCRLDGVAFHNFCRKLKRPYDERLSALMIQLTIELAKEFNVNAAYTQSDEISLGWNIEDYESEMFCNGRILKLNSHLASKTSVKFNRLLPDFLPEKVKDEAYFDARVMNLPNTVEAANMFLWREFDATRNSIQMAGQAYFSHKELHGQNGSMIQEMLFQKEKINWNDYPSAFKRGTFVLRRKVMEKPDLAKIPEKYRDKVNPDLPIEKSEFIKYDMPSFTKVTNRDRVLFFGEEPLLNQAVPA